MASSLRYRRVLVKVSGEAFGDRGVDGARTLSMARALGRLRKLGVEVAVVAGGGNLVRGASLAGGSVVERATADTMGMLATAINCLALADCLRSCGSRAAVLGAFPLPGVPPFERGVARRELGDGVIVLLAGGTGSPFFTTDTCAVVRARELEASLIVKATKVPGVFTGDPKSDPDAQHLERTTYDEVYRRRLGVLDLTALELAREGDLPLVVLAMDEEGALERAVRGEDVGTLILP